MSYLPLPAYLAEYSGKIKNFSLIFQKFFPYDGRDGWKTEESIDEIIKKYSADDGLLNKKNNQQKAFLAGYRSLSTQTMEVKAALTSRLITGIGETSPTEVGMVFDRNLGIPYIPASSVKGAVRYAYCVNYVRNGLKEGGSDPYIIISGFNTDEPGFKALFGSPDDKEPSKGGFCFMDVYPESNPEIKPDIMNPHFGNYYQGKTPPVETESPVPIKFLTVEKGLAFNFRGYFIKTRDADQYKNRLLDAFKTALEETGLGAKTAVGYGRFKLDGEDDNKCSKAAQPTKKESPKPETWIGAAVTYVPNSQTVLAKWEGKNARTKDISIIPETLVNKLIKKRKTVAATVKTDLIGGKEYQLLEIS